MLRIISYIHWYFTRIGHHLLMPMFQKNVLLVREYTLLTKCNYNKQAIKQTLVKKISKETKRRRKK